MRPRKEIDKLKAELQADIQKNFDKYKNAVIRDLYTKLKNFDGTDVESFKNNYLRNFHLTEKQKALFTKDLQNTQLQISAVWDQYFDRLDNFQPADYERLIASNRIDFNDVEDRIKTSVENELKRSVKAGYDRNVIIKRLENSGVGYSVAKTLTNTAAAQFDNSYMSEIATQAGVIYYTYAGSISKNTRDFCRERVGRVYTLDELRAMDNGQGLPVDSSLGGYHCQHHLNPLIDYVRLVYGELYNPSHHKNAA